MKKYVDVISLNDHNGNIMPLYLIFKDNKRIPIIRVETIKPQAAGKNGSFGLCFTCLFDNEQIRHLYYDRGKWYVELKDNINL